MKPEFAESSLSMTKYVMEEFYRKHLTSILPLFHPDIMWIGASEGQFYQSYDEVSRQLLLLQDIPECALSKQHYQIICKDSKTCTIAGSVIYSTQPASGEIISASQRLTFMWKMYKTQPRLIHMHISNPLLSAPQDIHFPHAAGRQTYEYVQTLLNIKSQKKTPLQMQGRNAEIYFFNPDDILYIEADNIHSIVHIPSASFEVCYPLNEMEKILTHQFLRIHRSFIVNKNNILRLDRYNLTLKSGGKLPVPEKKYKEIKNTLITDRNTF